MVASPGACGWCLKRIYISQYPGNVGYPGQSPRNGLMFSSRLLHSYTSAPATTTCATERDRKCRRGHARTSGDTPKRVSHVRVPRGGAAAGFRARIASAGTASRRACITATAGSGSQRLCHCQHPSPDWYGEGNQNNPHHSKTYRRRPSHPSQRHRRQATQLVRPGPPRIAISQATHPRTMPSYSHAY